MTCRHLYHKWRLFTLPHGVDPSPSTLSPIFPRCWCFLGGSSLSVYEGHLCIDLLVSFSSPLGSPLLCIWPQFSNLLFSDPRSDNVSCVVFIKPLRTDSHQIEESLSLWQHSFYSSQGLPGDLEARRPCSFFPSLRRSRNLIPYPHPRTLTDHPDAGIASDLRLDNTSLIPRNDP